MPCIAVPVSSRKRVGDVFYETRVLMGRQYTVRRFATEVLGGCVDPVMLGYIEKGKRLPNESLVRRLAAVRGEEAGPLIAVLYRDRMLYAFGRELKRALHDPAATAGVADADLAVQVSRAIAALPDDGTWIAARTWREQISCAVRGKAKKSDVDRVVALYAIASSSRARLERCGAWHDTSLRRGLLSAARSRWSSRRSSRRACSTS